MDLSPYWLGQLLFFVWNFTSFLFVYKIFVFEVDASSQSECILPKKIAYFFAEFVHSTADLCSLGAPMKLL